MLFQSYGLLGICIGFGIVVILLFLALRFFKSFFSLSFIGLLCALYSYLSYDYFVGGKFPVIAIAGLAFSIIGFARKNIICKVFSIVGIIVSGYQIITALGIF